MVATHNSMSPKLCTKCGEAFPPTTAYFHTRRASRDGLTSICKACARAKTRQWYNDNVDYAREKAREFRETHPDYVKNYNRQYSADHREEAKERTRLWAIANPERKRLADYLYHQRTYDVVKARLSVRAWRHAHPDGARAQLARRRAKIKAVGGTYTQADIDLQRKAQTDKRGILHCWWCGNPMTQYHIDHRIPLDKGGPNDPSNLCLAHGRCNQSKGAKLPGEWIGRLM